jgi:aminoglycoside 3-N-acetyltransferase I
MRDLIAVFGDAFDQADVYQAAPPGDDYLGALLAKPHIVVVAAFIEGHVVGGLVAYVLDKFEQDRREMYIYDLAVAEPFRRRGVATGLIGALQSIAAALDVYVIFVQADLVDGPAIALYEKLGAKETAHHFDIPVPRITAPR